MPTSNSAESPTNDINRITYGNLLLTSLLEETILFLQQSRYPLGSSGGLSSHELSY